MSEVKAGIAHPAEILSELSKLTKQQTKKIAEKLEAYRWGKSSKNLKLNLPND